jgi:hypothetical protein
VSRKDLSRTVIEGGRYFHNSYLRRASHGITRARTREWLDQVCADLDEADETAPRPGPRVHKLFRDKLGPAKRWLAAQVGRPWAKVYADLCARFDTRTTAGRHVVHDHMLPWVWRGDLSEHRSHRVFFVDAHGILRRYALRERAWWRLREEVLTWAQQRRASNTFYGWWWFHREPLGEACPKRWQCPHREHFEVGGVAYHNVRYVPDARLTPAELRRLDRLPWKLRALIVVNVTWSTGPAT